MNIRLRLHVKQSYLLQLVSAQRITYFDMDQRHVDQRHVLPAQHRLTCPRGEPMGCLRIWYEPWQSIAVALKEP